MTFTTLTTDFLPAPSLTANPRTRLVPAGPDIYRVVDERERIIGHLQVIPHPLGPRYRARRMRPQTSTFRDLGDFWSADDAVQCLRSRH